MNKEKTKYLIGYGETRVLKMDLNDGEVDPDDRLKIDAEYFEKIYHLRFDSSKTKKDKKKVDQELCFVACQRKAMKQICCFNLHEGINTAEMMKREIESSEDEGEDKDEEKKEDEVEKPEVYSKMDDMETITFYEDVSEHTKAHITQDCEKIVFCNGSENIKVFIGTKTTS